jgi:hypothetical protein
MTDQKRKDDLNDPEHSRLSADQRAHGAHGRGRNEEQRIDDETVHPGTSERDRDSEPTRGADGWGAEGAGGSVIDTRPEKGRG